MITRDQAKASGLKWYFTGTPCRKGHIAERQVSNYCCRVCALEKFRNFYSDNAEQQRKRSAEWRESNKERVNADRRKRRKENPESYRKEKNDFYAANTERERQRSAEWRKQNPEKVKSSAKNWKDKNRAIATANQIEREAIKRRARPVWADREKIKQAYLAAAQLTKLTGIPHHVDHFYPLRSKFVSGLHVEHNLRVIPAIDNLKKNNKLVDLI